MSFSVKIMAYGDILHVIVKGKFELDEAKRNFVRVMDAVTKNGSTRVLMDGRAVTGEPTVIERYIYGEFAANVATWRSANEETQDRHQFAYVLTYPTLDRKRRGETVAADRGMNIKVFDNLSDAAAWLNIDQNRIGVPANRDIDTRAADHR